MNNKMNKKFFNSMMKKVVSVFTIFVMLFSVFACDYQSGNGFAFAAQQQYGIVVTPNGLNVRSGAGTNNTAIITLPFDTEVLILGEAKDSSGNKWYKISKTFDGDEIVGYVMAKDSYIVLKSESQETTTDTPVPGLLESNCTYSDVLMEVGKQVGMNPYVIASMIIVEQGTNGVGASISGKNTGYEGYYNYFNINAVAKDGYTAVVNGLKYAKSDGTYYRPWNSRFKSILGGADLYAQNYILKNQNTLYFKKWNVMNGLSNVAVHQYMTNIEGAYEEAKNLKIGYQGLMDEALSFIIPVYNNMPKDVALPPSTSNNDELNEELAIASETGSLEGATGTEMASSVIQQPYAITEPTVSEEYVPADPYEISLMSQGFPASYLPLISALHYAHPTWTFKPAITGLDWNDVVKKETVLGKSLVSKTKGEYWKSKKSPAYDSSTGTYKSYDTGGWNAASTVAVEYFLDPRRFISETGIFIFMSQEYDPLVQNINGLNKIVSGTFMKGAFPEYVEIFGPKSENPSNQEGSQGSEGTSGQESTSGEIAEKNQRIIDGVENTTLKNSSTRTSNGIKISWTKSPGYKVDYYEVYRSTKKSSGYGKTPFYKTSDGNKTNYTNTKDLKKGNTYYYKVRGVREIDGKKYYTNYSTKSWRTIK